MNRSFGVFEPGAQLVYGDRVGRLRLFESDVAVITFRDGDTINVESSELLDAHQDGSLRFLASKLKPRNHRTVSADEEARIELMTAYLMPLRDERFPNGKGVRERVIQEVSARIQDPNPPGPSTLSRWYQAWVLLGYDTPQLVVKEERQRKLRLPEEYQRLMEEVIRDEYLKRSSPTAVDVYDKFEKRFKALNYVDRCPDISTFRRLLKRLAKANQAEFLIAREGRSEARAKMRTVNNRIEPKHPLDRVECDTAHFNLGLLNNDGVYLGKTSLYLVIDCCTRAILGYAVQVSNRPNRELSANVIHALRYSVAWKDDPEYPMYGRIRELVTDAGPGYRAEHSKAFFIVIADSHTTTATRQGWGKPFVESSIKTFRQGFFSTLDGYLGKYDPTKFSDDTVAKSATLTIDEFRDKIHHFICNIYHHTPHSGLEGRTPFEAWCEGIKTAPPLAVDDLEEVGCLRGLRMNRKLSRLHGVTVDYQFFNSDALTALFDDVAENLEDTLDVEIRVDPLDASAVTVVCPRTGALVDVPNVRESIGKRSFLEANAIRKANKGRKRPRTDKPNETSERSARKKHKRGPAVPICDVKRDDHRDRNHDIAPTAPIVSLEQEETHDDDAEYDFLD